MTLLLKPGIQLMQRLRFLPKFILMTVVFTVPLLLVTTLLFNELDKSIAIARQERTGVDYIRQVQKITLLTQQHRALRHMALGGNASAKDKAARKQAELNAMFASVTFGQKDLSAFGADETWDGIKHAWSALQSSPSADNAKEDYAAHTTLIARMYKFGNLLADRSHLTLDPEVDTYYLIAAFTKALPNLAEGLSEIAGRGAAYIDTGLLEPNEDVMLNSGVMTARSDLARIPAMLETMFRENPGFRPVLEPRLAVISSAGNFLDRAKDEVLNTLNQTSGDRFFEAGSKNIDDLYALANTSATLLDGLLQQRIDNYSARRNAMVAGICMTFLIAAYLLAGFYRSFTLDVNNLAKAVSHAASGDLTYRTVSGGRDEIALLLSAFNEMNEGLATLVADVRLGADTIAIASHEIASGNSDLSARTEQQASSLGETSASMTQLTGTVQQNADHAQQAKQLALSASEIANRGGTAVTQVVDTMTSISESANRIDDILAMIDGIAFQTNILALNAAVEAARAGEQGRGFAVVAAEVRNLARRSAAAAKEIKLLVADSAERIAIGRAQADQAGRTMHQIVDSVNRVTDIMCGISTASGDQRTGIEQINQAIGQMDEITQQNAALVEQSAAAAESMHEQAIQLAQAVSAFKLNGPDHPAATDPKPAPTVSRNVFPLSSRNAQHPKNTFARTLRDTAQDDTPYDANGARLELRGLAVK